ncbi:bZIP transcription factor [Aspergillus lucknowensis]|uniref:BZIP domain-containing protein n=1 Tax=Aspergillus lucknowensis TaxID=176173 RepID=A0ABR4M720_9EURO
MDKLKSFTSRWSLKDEDGDKASSSGVRRKEQLRRAQQNYRQRKEGYVKSLETEVVHLRTCRSDLQGETQRLTAEIEWLRHIIDANHIVLPPPPEGVVSLRSSPESSAATVCVSRDHHNNKRLIVLDQASDTSGSPASTQNPSNGFHPSSSSNPTDVVVGMNFILSLEGPCLDHVRSALQSPGAEQSHGHALTLTASVFRLYGDSGLPQEEEQLLNVSRKTLDRLLELSSQLTTADELTPIQVWALVRQNPWVAQAQSNQLMSISERLLDYIKCYGYGAVVPRSVVLEALQAIQRT